MILVIVVVAKSIKSVVEKTVKSSLSFSPRPKGYFFSLEGLDGCGKSTQIESLQSYFLEQGLEVVVVREPGGEPFAEKIRDLLLHQKNNQIHDTTELLLFFAARNQVIQHIILPALEANKIVIADRFVWSSFAYQGFGRGLDLKTIRLLSNIVCEDVVPLHTFILDIPLSIMYKRRGQKLDRMENQDQVFFKNVIEGYHQIAKANSKYISLITGTQPTDVIFKTIVEHIKNYLNTYEN